MAVTEQNLSDWRQGGYEDWLRHQDARAFARCFLAEAEELEEEIGDSPLTDRATEVAALSLLRLLHDAESEEGPNRRAAVIEIIREMQRLRRGDHALARLQIRQARWEAEQVAVEQVEEQKLKAETEEMKNKADWLKFNGSLRGNAMWREYRDGMADGSLKPERAAELRAYFEKNADWLRQCSVPALPPPPSPQNSSGAPPARRPRRHAATPGAGE